MKSYTYLLVKALVFILCLMTIDYLGGIGFESLQKATFKRHPESLSFKTQYMVDRCESDIVIVGSSKAAHAFIPSIIEDSTGLTTYNCAMDGHFFIYQNECINLLLDRYSPKAIIWDIGESVLSTSHELEYKSINDLYPYYNKRESTKKLIDGKDKWSKFRSLSNLYRYNSTLSGVVYEMISPKHFPGGYVPIETTGYLFPGKWNGKRESVTVDSSKIKTLHNTINVCKHNNVTLLFVITPTYAESTALKSNDYLALVNLLNQEQVDLLNYYNVFDNDSTLFKDVNHLNDNGAKSFMSVFIPQLKGILETK